ncbi:aromatic ring-hydroxylating dioxygenase subunit alpha [Sphingomonas sp. SUN019]|uniref:aromatic ring-hydroxylating oxygenase subunit alpha n=1 Tax=Sphingomonas sp. SUN019 TaxID=2937788 RepID=UPI002164987B|nr:aromatic ring-hydroxylating dioxygenase subunit alpha [Sphingomonas sp. SUN019]UVO50011.1 aromatic ring-hydroxylating dioxygenase subunit alpha [Sphingomonas sp. SUN019]
MSGWPVAIANGWYPLARLSDLGRKPVARRLLGQPLVVFAGKRDPVVLHDRCPHRGMPLSEGRVANGRIICPYHGWAFGDGGVCRAVPGSRDVTAVSAAALPVRIAAGMVWTTLGDGAFPVLPAAMEDEALDRFWWPVAASRARVLDALENHLDPAHPHHVHPWIVRAPDKRQLVAVTVEVTNDGASTTYVEETRATGLIPRLFEGHRTTSIGRLYPPTIGEVAFTGPAGLRLSIAVVFVPEDAATTRPWAHFATPRGRLPASLKRILLKAFHRPILAQDRRILSRQADRKGAYAIGPLDFLGPAIWGFANGNPPPPSRYETSVLL